MARPDGSSTDSFPGDAAVGSVAVVIPSYRSAGTVTATLRSLLAQERGLGMIGAVYLADDGSHDGTIEAARAVWASDVPLVTYEHAFNFGEYAVVNLMVEALPPDITWFLVLHADDEAKPDWLGTILDELILAGPMVGSVCTSYDYYDGTRVLARGEDSPVVMKAEVPGDHATVVGTLLRGCWWHISGCAIRTRAFRQVGGLPKMMQQKGDWDFLLRLLANGWSVTYVPTSPFLYRATPDGSSGRNLRRHIDLIESVEVVQRFRSYLSARQVLSLHTSYARSIARRAASSLVTLDWDRLIGTAPTICSIGASLATCLVSSRPRWGAPAPADRSPA